MSDEKRPDAVGTTWTENSLGRMSGGCERRLLWIERERRARSRTKFKDAWAEGSAGLRVTAKQEQIFCTTQNRQIAASEHSVSGQPFFVLRLQMGRGRFRHRPAIPYTRGTTFLIKHRHVRPNLPWSRLHLKISYRNHIIVLHHATLVKLVSIPFMYKVDHNRYIVNRPTTVNKPTRIKRIDKNRHLAIYIQINQTDMGQDIGRREKAGNTETSSTRGLISTSITIDHVRPLLDL
jgi:hypothetical protein